MKRTFIVLSTFLLILSSNAHAGLFGPSNFEECVLDALKDAKTEYAAQLVQAMCLEKFPISNKSSVSTLIEGKKGKLICDTGWQGYPPYQVSFDRTQEIFSVNSKTFNIHSQTKGKIYATPDNEDMFLLNLETGVLTLSTKEAEIVFYCEVAIR